MRKVELRLNESEKYLVIKKLVETNGNKQRAAIQLGCSYRHVNRLVQGYKTNGKAFFLHGNRNKPPAHKTEEPTRNLIASLYMTKYAGANFAHFTELLRDREKISLSRSTIRAILMEKDLLSPMAIRKTRKDLRKKLETQQTAAPSKKQQDRIHDRIVDLEEAHPRRSRSPHFGELIQMDASTALWFGNQKTYLHLAVDDCTGSIVGAWFDEQETLNGYYHVLKQILENHGIPYRFFTDRRTVFEYIRKGTAILENDTFTQFGYACRQLGIDIRTTSTPQAKGRVERMFRTLKSRLLTLLRLEDAISIEQANAFLHHYVREFNIRFAHTIDYTTSVFESSPSTEKINLTLAVLTQRTVDSGHCLRFQNTFYRPVEASGSPVHYRRGTPCMVIQAFDGSLFTSIGEKIHALEKVPEHLAYSRDFGEPVAAPIPQKRYVPPMSHPWKAKTFEDYVRSQSHSCDHVLPSFEDVIYSQEIFY